MSGHLTPGLSFLLSHSPTLLGPALSLYVVRTVYERVENTRLDIPTLAWIAALALAMPLWLVLKVQMQSLKEYRDAKANGASLPSVYNGKLPGNLDKLVDFDEKWRTGYMGEGWSDAVDEHGPTVTLRFLWENVIFTTEPHHIKAILATDFSNWIKGESFRSACGSVLGEGVFNVDGDMWKFHRSMSRPFFSKERISDYENFERHSQIAISKLKLRQAEGQPVDIQDLFYRFTLDSGTEFLFGADVGSLDAELLYPYHLNRKVARHASDDFARSFGAAQELAATRQRMGWMWPLLEMSGDKTKVHMDAIKTFIDPIVEGALGKKHARDAKDPSAEDEQQTLLGYLMQSTDDIGIIRDEIVNILVAGRDTTAALITFVLYFLALHPDVTKRLRSEILNKVGSERAPTSDDVRDMKYLRAVINETLRLLPIVPFDVRESVRPTLWENKQPGGKPYFIPGKTRAIYSVYLMHRREDLWGPDALEFDPDRFIDERLRKYMTPNPFIFTPFNAGPRICLGQQFAYNEASFMLVRLLQQFDQLTIRMDAQHPDARPPESWASASGRKAIEKLRPAVGLTMYAQNGLWMDLREALVHSEKTH